MSKFNSKLTCFGAGYVGGLTMAVLASKIEDF